MAGVKVFEELAVWQKAREFTKSIYAVTSEGRWAKDYGLCDQIRRASVSIMSNIAEGFERMGENEFGRFLSMAKGSAGEVRSQLYVALDVGYLDERSFEELRAQVVEVSRMISGLASYLKSDRSRGTKAAPATGRP
jgi:four helix bundle protein